MQRLGLRAHAAATPDRVALVCGEERITFATLAERAARAANAFAARGIGQDDVVAIAVRNRPAFIESTFGAALLRAEVVPIPWRAKAEEMRYLIDDSGAALLVAEDDAPSLHDVRALRVGREYEAALADASPTPPRDAPTVAPALLRFYTSGTTGRPKAVVRARPTIEGYIRGVVTSMERFGVDGSDGVHLCCGPLYHSAPASYASYALLLGQRVVLMPRFDAEAFLRAVQDERATWAMMVPIHFIRILGLPEDVRARYDLSSMRRILHAAAPCPADVKRGIMAMFPGAVWEFYGMTEGRATMISPQEWERKPGSVGRPFPGVDITILDAAGAEAPPGETGVVYVRDGGARFSYAGDPEKTAEAWRGEYFTVGDMGYVDEDGYLFLTDRAQDMIISGGSNVYPAEVEAVLLRHPGVVDCAVIGIPDEEWGEAVHAVVEVREDVADDDLIALCRRHLAHYKCPRTVGFVERLPRDPNGKVRKRELRAPFWEGRARQI